MVRDPVNFTGVRPDRRLGGAAHGDKLSLGAEGVIAGREIEADPVAGKHDRPQFLRRGVGETFTPGQQHIEQRRDAVPERNLMTLDQFAPCVRIAPLIFHNDNQRAAGAQNAKNVVNR